MLSLCDELLGRIRAEAGATRRSQPRQDLGMLLFADRERINELWKAAEGDLAGPGEGSRFRLREAVEALRPLFGER